MVIYLVALGGGIFALAFTPESVVKELADWDILVVLWGGLLVLGGLLGFVGRLTRVWVIETPGTVASIFGAAIYVVVLGATAFTTTTAAVAVCLIVISALCLLRRYTELQIFTTDPEADTFTERLRAALARRTGNTAGTNR